MGYTAGGYVKISTVVGEWQANGRPWHIVFRANKTIDMSSEGAVEAGSTEPGTFLLWTEGNVIIKLQSGRVFTAPFRGLTPNQFGLVDSENGAVTVFKRIL